jgi:hypothetical protein
VSVFRLVSIRIPSVFEFLVFVVRGLVGSSIINSGDCPVSYCERNVGEDSHRQFSLAC